MRALIKIVMSITKFVLPNSITKIDLSCDKILSFFLTLWQPCHAGWFLEMQTFRCLSGIGYSGFLYTSCGLFTVFYSYLLKLAISKFLSLILLIYIPMLFVFSSISTYSTIIPAYMISSIFSFSNYWNCIYNCLLNRFILMFAGIPGLICPNLNSLFPQHPKPACPSLFSSCC